MRNKTAGEILILLLTLAFVFYLLPTDFNVIQRIQKRFSFFRMNDNYAVDQLINKKKAVIPEPNSNDFCEGENMVYGVGSDVASNGNFPHIPLLKGKKFDCALLRYLEQFNLTDKWHRRDEKSDSMRQILDPRKNNSLVFVFATDIKFYASLRAVIAGVRERFHPEIPIIVYDLGDLATPRKTVTPFKELASVCNLEVRVFNFSKIPFEVRALKIFAWKVYILAEMFSQFPLFIYCDTSIHFLTDDYSAFFKRMNESLLSDFQFTMGTHHGLKFATDSDMFSYIPLDPRVIRTGETDVEMMEANMMIVRRSEFTRRLLKWSLLCAMTPECINPIGSQLSCKHYDLDQLEEDGICHRQDQSVMNILLHNLELEIVNSGSLITTHLRYNHPRWVPRHLLKRRQQTDIDIAQRYKCPFVRA